MKFAIKPKEVKTWIGLGILGVGTGLMFAPAQDKATELLQSAIGGDWWIFVIAGGLISIFAMLFFRVD